VRVLQVRTYDRAPDCIETLDLTSHRKLDPLLFDTDIRLQIWGAWARPYYANSGFPVVSGPVIVPRADWPSAVVASDDAVQVLHWALSAAVMAQYFNTHQPAQQRAAAYARLVQHFVSLRSDVARRVRGADCFRSSLDRARWSLRALLAISA
jgi:hypothetical protein